VRARDATSPARIDDQRITRAALRRRLAGLYAAIKRARTLISPFRSIVAADGAAEAVGVHLSLSLALSLSLPLLQCTYAPRSSVDASSLMPFSRNDRERGPARAIARNYCSLRGHERRASKIPFELAGELRGRKGEREEMEGEVGREVMETAAGSRGGVEGGGRRRAAGREGGRERGRFAGGEDEDDDEDDEDDDDDDDDDDAEERNRVRCSLEKGSAPRLLPLV